jgi:hypothetical protein
MFLEFYNGVFYQVSVLEIMNTKILPGFWYKYVYFFLKSCHVDYYLRT